MIYFKVIVVIASWLVGFIQSRKHRQSLLIIPICITIAVLFLDKSNMSKLNESLVSLTKSYTPIEKTALEHYPYLPKEEAITNYLKDIDKMKEDNKKLKHDQADSIEEIKRLKYKDAKQQEHQNIIQEFSVVASWNYMGDLESGGGVIIYGPLSVRLRKFVTEENGYLSCKCDRTALDNYKDIIKKYPNYPFPYLYIASCLKPVKDPSWGDYATKGLDLFKKTIIVPTHAPSHEKGLQNIKEILQK